MIIRILIGLMVFLCIVAVGIIVQISYIRKKTGYRNFIVEYINDLVEYAKNNDYQVYDKLIHNMNEAQMC